MGNQFRKWIILVIASLFLVPAVVYISGSPIVGPYEGDYGMLGMMRKMYGDAILLKAGAWLVLFSPVLLAGIWYGCFKLQRIIQNRQPA